MARVGRVGGVIVGLFSAWALGPGCAEATGGSAPPDAGADGTAARGGSGATGGSGGGSGASGGSGGTGGTFGADAQEDGLTLDSACGLYTEEARPTAAAIMIVLDRSSSMAVGGKWSAAQQAIASAIDTDGFDDLALGLIAYPTEPRPIPPCLQGLTLGPPMCGVTQLPQVQLADTGKQKSNQPATVRNAIYTWLVSNAPDRTLSDASPGYEAMQAGIRALRAYAMPEPARRIMIFVTDGGFSCASMSNPTRPGYSDGACPDWEWPSSVISLLELARNESPSVETFVIGVPGSNSNGGNQGLYATPPYVMRNALSAYAAVGSPSTVPPTCDGRTFTFPGTQPTQPCHYDMTTGAFNAQTLSDVLTEIRGKALGCSFSLPRPDAGDVDRNRVNVDVTTDAGKTRFKKRRDATDDCAADGCWDYEGENGVVLLGRACSDLQASRTQRVDVLVGCVTEVK